MGGRICFLFLLFVLLAAVDGAHNERGEMEPPQRDTILKTAGGKVELWSREFKPLQNANIEAVLITLEEGGLVLPQYADSPALYYVKEGDVRVGLAYPWGDATNLWTASKGSLVAIPAGWTFWWHNSDSAHVELLSIADISYSIYPGRYKAVHLAGDKTKEGGPGGMLHGFSTDFLARAWDVSEDTVEKFVHAQTGIAITKVEKGFSTAEHEKGRTEEEAYFGEFVFKLGEASPDLDVKEGGFLSVLTRDKWPALKQIGLAALYARLEPGALFAPGWSPTSHGVAFVTKGKGRIQIASPDGDVALDMDVKEGDLFVLPRFHPALKFASQDEGLEWVLVTTGSRPLFSFLAGKNSIYKAFPLDILTEGFNVSVDFETKILRQRTHDNIIFPPKKEDAESQESPESFGTYRKTDPLEGQAMAVWFNAQESLE